MIPQALVGGFQTLAALTLGVGALVTVPLIGTTGSSDNKSSSESDSDEKSLSEPESSPPLESHPVLEGNSPLDLGRSVVKSSLVWLFDVIDQTQNFFAESAESFQDLITEAKIEQQAIAKSREENISVPNKSNFSREIPIDD
ncbi:MAG TPA: hypothetical protein V6D25_28770 [Leptolyngbyaceae cyanobacterium]